MTPGGVRHVWQVVARQLDIAPFSPHRLRHTFATNMLAQGVDIRVVAELMGHRNLSSIMVYTEVAESARQDAMRAFKNVVQPGIPEQTLAPDPRASTPNPPT